MGLITLVVDDCAAIRSYVRKQLTATRLEIDEILEAGDGSEALGVLENSLRKGVRPDFIITDIHMPVMSGEAFVERLRASREFREVPVLVFSSDASQSGTLRMRSLGVRGYVTKPCEPDVLRSKIENVLLGRDDHTSPQGSAGSTTLTTYPRSILMLGSERARGGQLELELIKLGHQVTVASSAAEALHAVNGDFPDLLITDVHLHGEGEGIAAAGRLLESCECPVLYVTADTTDEMVERALGTNPYGYITEPFDGNSLRAALLGAFYKQAARRRHRTRERLFAGVLSSLTDALMVTDSAGVIVFLNLAAAELCGHTIASATGSKVADVFRVSSESEPQMADDLIQTARTQQVPSISGGSATLTRKDGEQTSISFQVGAIWRDSGVCEGVVFTFAAANLVEGRAGELARLRALDRAAHAPPQPASESKRRSVASSPQGQPGPARGRSKQQTPQADRHAHPTTDPADVSSKDEAAAVLRHAISVPNDRQYVIVFVMERFRFYEKRFGQASLNSARIIYAQHLSSMLWPQDQIYEWGDNAFVVLTERPWSLDEMRREVAVIACKRIEHTVHPAGRVAMLVLTSCWELQALSSFHTVEPLFEEIESFRKRKGT